MSFAQSDHTDTFPLGCTVDIASLFSSRGLLQPYPVKGGFLIPLSAYQGYEGHISLHNTATVMMHYQNPALYAAAGFLEEIRNVCRVKILDNLYVKDSRVAMFAFPRRD